LGYSITSNTLAIVFTPAVSILAPGSFPGSGYSH
jgi:hypothetical protein